MEFWKCSDGAWIANGGWFWQQREWEKWQRLALIRMGSYGGQPYRLPAELKSQYSGGVYDKD
jgi:hypothetical protein